MNDEFYPYNERSSKTEISQKSKKIKKKKVNKVKKVLGLKLDEGV